MINNDYSRPYSVWNNEGTPVLPYGIFVDGIPTALHGEFVHDGIENGYYFHCRRVYVQTPGSTFPLVLFKRFYYVPMMSEPGGSPSFDNLRNRVSVPQNTSSPLPTYTNNAPKEPSQPLSAAAPAFIPSSYKAAQAENETSRNDQTASSSAVAVSAASCITSNETLKALPQASPPSTMRSIIEKTKAAATATQVIPAKIDGPITDSEEVGYVGAIRATTLLAPEVIEMAAQRAQERQGAWASPKMARQPLSTPLGAAKSETSSRQDSQANKKKTFVETAPLKPTWEERKMHGGQVSCRLRDPLDIGVCFPSEELCSAGKQHMLKRLQIFYSICLFFEKNRSFFQEFEVLDETWGSIQYFPNNNHFEYKSQQFEYQNAHISIFPKILLVKKGNQEREKFQLSDCPITYHHVDGRRLQTTMHHLLNVCDFAPRFINDIDCLAEVNPYRRGARHCGKNLFNRIIHENYSTYEAMEEFSQIYEKDLLLIQEQLNKEANPYERQRNEESFTYLQQNKSPAHKCLRGMIEVLRKITAKHHQSSSPSCTA
jgi:hypothetical protein